MDTIDIDGSVGEGGGQILRTSLALSMCTGRPVSVRRIRAGRPRPGLMRQHLTCVQAAAAVCAARVEGAKLGSQALYFTPGPVKAGDYGFDVGSAGSCTLVLQTILPALMQCAAPSRVSLKGGTHNPLAPPYHFLERSFAPLLRRLGVGVELALIRHGFYPAGGGEMRASIMPDTAALQPFDITSRGAAGEPVAECLAPGLRDAVATRELAALGEALGWSREQLRTPAIAAAEGPGNALMATLPLGHITEMFTAFGEKGVPSEAVARALAGEVKAFLASDGALGPHLTDQWMLPLALAVARAGVPAAYTCSEITGHAQTNAQVIERFVPVRFAIEPGEGAWRVGVAPGRARWHRAIARPTHATRA